MPKDLPSGFDKASIVAGLRKAMEFGAPTRSADRATFYFRTTETVVAAVDESGVPFDPSVRPTVRLDSKTVPCAVEFLQRAEIDGSFGVIQPNRVVLTLLDPDWQAVKLFEFVTIGGDRYDRRYVEPPVALGSLDVWTVHCVAEDES